MPTGTVPGRTPISAGSPPNAGSGPAPGNAPGGPAPARPPALPAPGGPTPGSAPGGGVPGVVPRPLPSFPGGSASAPAIAVVPAGVAAGAGAGAGAGASVGPAGVAAGLAIGGLVGLIAWSLRPESQIPVAHPPITSPSGGLRPDALYRVTMNYDVWFLSDKTDVSPAVLGTNSLGSGVVGVLSALANQLVYNPEDGMRKELATGFTISLIDPGVQPEFSPDFSGVPGGYRPPAFAPPHPLDVNGDPAVSPPLEPSPSPLFSPSPGIVPTLPPAPVGPPPLAPEVEPEPDNPLPLPEPLSPAPAYPAPAPNPAPSLEPGVTGVPGLVPSPLVNPSGYLSPPIPRPPLTGADLPPRRNRTTENCCIDTQPDCKEDLEEIKKKLEEIEECACPPRYTVSSQSLGSGSSVDVNIPPLTISVQVAINAPVPRTRTQWGGGVAPDVFFIGWYAFGTASGFGDRKPLSYDTNVLLPPSEDVTRFTATLKDGNVGNFSCLYRKEVED